MARTVPVVANEVPGNFLTGALWTSQVSAIMQWTMGSGTNGVPRFKGYAASTQSIGTGTTDIPLNLDTEDWDSDNGHSTSTNTSRYTVQVAGTYRVTGVGGVVSSATGNRKLGINLNGVNVRGAAVQQASLATNSWCGCVSTEVACVVGDYIEVVIWQSSGGPLNTATGSSFGPSLMCCWISS